MTSDHKSQTYSIRLLNPDRLRPIRSIRDYIFNLMVVIQEFEYNQDVATYESIMEYVRRCTTTDCQETNVDCLFVPSMKRMTIVSRDQIQSFAFPYTLSAQSGYLLAETNNGVITNKIASMVIKFLNDYYDNDIDTIAFCMDEIGTDSVALKADVDTAVDAIVTAIRIDASYFRQDHDEQHEDEHGLHPLNHLDIFYSDVTSIKFGLVEFLDAAQFHNMISKATKAYYVKTTF